MFQDDIPLTQTGPVTFGDPTSDVPPITINVPATPGVPAIKFQSGPNDQIGGITEVNGVPTLTDASGNPTTSLGGSTGTPCQVLSGSGSTYQVQLYPAGPSGTPGLQVACKQLQIDNNATIPGGTWAVAFSGLQSVHVGDPKYFMQVPVWLT